MAGPNLELFKFSLYLFFPLAIMIHYGDPQWYHDNVLPVRSRFWPEEESLYRPPRNAADLKAELAELRTHRLTNKERREQGLPPLAPPTRQANASTASTSSSSTAASNQLSASLREGASLGSIWMKDETPAADPGQRRTRTWRETWQEATERHVV